MLSSALSGREDYAVLNEDGPMDDAEGIGTVAKGMFPGAEVVFLPDETETDALETEARERIRSGRPVSGIVPSGAQECIYLEGIYYPETEREHLERLRCELDPERFSHTCRVVRQAALYAERFSIDYRKARTAAMLHDCAKCIDKPTLFLLSGESEFIPPILHAPAGAVIARNRYGITDDEVLRAIRLHCTGDAAMDKLCMAVFLADMTESGRDFPAVDEIRDAVWQSLEYGMLTALRYEMRYLKTKGSVVHPATERALTYYRTKEA